MLLNSNVLQCSVTLLVSYGTTLDGVEVMHIQTWVNEFLGCFTSRLWFQL